MTDLHHHSSGEEVDHRLFVGSVLKAMKVMEAFDHEHRALSLSQIAERAGMGRSAAQRFAYTLEVMGYLRREPGTKRYLLANRVLRLVHSMLSANTALDRSFHLLARLAEQTGETISWVERDDNEIVVVSSVPSPHRTAIVLPIGSRFPILTASSGQLYLADEPEDVVRQVFERADDAQLKRINYRDISSYRAMIEQNRQRGFAMTEKDVDVSSLSISAPVRDFRGRMIAALNVSILRERLQPEDALKSVVPALVEAANAAGKLAFG